MTKFLKSFVYAFRGIKEGFKGRNIRAQGFCAVVALGLGVLFKLSEFEWIIISLLIALVLASELFNTALEEVCNHLRDDLGLSYDATREARDIAAGAVLVLSIFSAFIGFTIFVPKVF